MNTTAFHRKNWQLIKLTLRGIFMLFILLSLTDIVLTDHFKAADSEVLEIADNSENESEENQKELEEEVERDNYVHEFLSIYFATTTSAIKANDKREDLNKISQEVATPPPERA